jgi:basic membrane protein A and related proteins
MTQIKAFGFCLICEICGCYNDFALTPPDAKVFTIILVTGGYSKTMAKVIGWSFLALLGMFVIVSALTGMNVALTQTSELPEAAPLPSSVLPKQVIALRLPEGNWSDPYSEALWQGVTHALRETSSENVDVVLYNETSPLANDVDMVLAAGSALETHVTKDALAHPEKNFVMFSAQPLAGPSNLHRVTFEDHEATYLLGYLAGTLSQTRFAAFIADTQNADTLERQAAFSQGLLAACSSCELYSAFVSDAVAARNAADTFQQKGADIFFAYTGDAGQSVTNSVINYVNETMCAAAVKTRPSPLTSALTMVAKDITYLSQCSGSYPLFFMGTGRYQPALGDNDNDPSTLNHGLTSLEAGIDVAAYKTVRAFMAGETVGDERLSLKDNAVHIAVNAYNRALLPEEVLARLEDIKGQIVAGEIVVDKVLKK